VWIPSRISNYMETLACKGLYIHTRQDNRLFEDSLCPKLTYSSHYRGEQPGFKKLIEWELSLSGTNFGGAAFFEGSLCFDSLPSNLKYHQRD
jgi:hypothetical protein